MSLVVTGLRKRYGQLRVLRGIDFECERGEVCALVGDNGSGKSTTLSIIAGLIPADGGAAEIDGDNLLGRRPVGRARLGFVPEKANPPDHMNGRQLFGLIAALKGAEPPSQDRLSAFGIEHLLRRPVGGLSLGQRRRLCLAAALIGEPSLLLLDEPTNGLDKDGAAVLVELIALTAQSDVAIVIATHDIELIEATNARKLRLDGGALTKVD